MAYMHGHMVRIHGRAPGQTNHISCTEERKESYLRGLETNGEHQKRKNRRKKNGDRRGGRGSEKAGNGGGRRDSR